MTVTKIRTDVDAIKQLLASDGVPEAADPGCGAGPEAEMVEALRAEKGERTEARVGYRSGCYTRLRSPR